jgi:DNA-binding NarL/FixJ family response regulator
MEVLIIDSFALIIQRLEELLKESSHVTNIHSAFSYTDGMRMFTEAKPGVVILSLGLPSEESVEFLNVIRLAGHLTPVIVLSINMDEYLENQYRLLGANYFLDKYRDFEKLPSIIQHIAGDSKASRHYKT